VFLTDKFSGAKFLADSGAVVSIFPGPVSSSASVPSLKSLNGSQIRTGGERRLRIAFSHKGGIQTFSWDFVVGQVECPVLGTDFLTHFNLVVDIAAGCVRDKTSGAIFAGDSSSSSTHSAVSAAVPAGVETLLSKFPRLANPSSVLPPAVHKTQHFLVTDGPPVCSRFRRLNPEKLADAKKIFAEWEANGVVRRSSSNWSSPLHMVRKKDGSWRPCGDFRRLNLITKQDKYPVPSMADFAAQLEGCKVFSTLDLRNGYLQVPLHPSAVPKTAIITPFGLFEFLRMPFGLRNAGMSFQRLMDQVMAGLPFVVVYIDDILVASADHATHLLHLEEVFSRLNAAGLVLNLDKCNFAKQEVSFLGHKVSAAGSRPLPEKVAALQTFPQPNCIKELQQFLGMLNFYRKFLPQVAKILSPLTDALRGSPPPGQLLTWSPAMLSSFQSAKTALSNATVLCHPSRNAELALVADASASHVGGVLQQKPRGTDSWQPLGFFSQKLDRAQAAYSAFDRELLAAFTAVRHFRYQLEGQSFQIWTDHKPLTFALSRVSDAWSPRQQRQLAFLAEYTADIRHVPGSDNIVADTLSRPPAVHPPPPAVVAGAQSPATASSSSSPAATTLPPAAPSQQEAASVPVQQSSPSSTALPPLAVVAGAKPPAAFGVSTLGGVDLIALAKAQQGCQATAELQQSPSLRVSPLDIGGESLLCDFSTGIPRPLVPPFFQKQVFTAVHSLSHPGIKATRRLICSRWLWKKMSADISTWCRDCQPCSRSKVISQPHVAVQPIPIPGRRFSHVHIDLVGPLPMSSEGFSHILTIVDRSSRWIEAIPLSSTTAAAVADAFLAGWVARFGVPDDITSDRGVQFTSELWSLVMARLGISHHLTSAYHPQSNGMVERAHRQLKSALKARNAAADWPSHLPWVLLGIRSSPKDDGDISAAELLYGAPISLPSQPPQPLEPPPQKFVESFPPSERFLPLRPCSYSEAAARPSANLLAAKFAYIRRGGASSPLSAAYSGPYSIISKATKTFVLAVGGRLETVSVDRLKPHLGPSPVDPASPPRRGRPPLRQPAVATADLGGGSVAAALHAFRQTSD